ncbi:hypothetical protein F5X68DRAFT_3914 [Plectosphaerella plurivora]|uniref:Uncharacterized protein n=1 Tax=Plectosphaerella plurivora TaxID=936078 RepID=A0A9P8VMT7_9PEZI|nr:hypothetical protein F5X68DRAFT_3914 [Plectosphaerella plurivora]
MNMSFRQIPLVAALVLARLAAVLAQDQNVQFNQVVNINGDMQLNRVVLPDGSRVETFSQTQRQIIINQNTVPLPASHVVGSTGQPFVQLSPQSMIIQTNQANDLVGGQIIMPFDRNALTQNQITVDNTFMAKLSPDRQAWVILEESKTVNDGESNVRMVRQTTIDGEYVVVGRRTAETGQSLAAFSQDPNAAIRIDGSGIQEVEWQDGLRMSVRASQPMAIQANVVNGVSSGMITSGTQPVNNYRYLVTSNLAGVTPDLNRMAAVVQIPLNGMRLMQAAQQMGAGPNDRVALSIEQRAVVQNPGGASGQLRPAPQKRQDPAQSSSSSSSAAPQASAPPAEGQQSTPPAGGQQSSPPAATPSAPPADAQQPPPQQGQQPPPQQGQQPPPQQGQQPPPQQGQQPPPQQGQQPPPAAPINAPPAATQLLLAPTFTPIARQTILDMENNRVAVPVDSVDGEFILVMQLAQPGQPGQQPGGQLPGQQPGQQPGGQLPGGQLPGGQLPGGQVQQPPRETPAQLPGQTPGQTPEAPGQLPGQTPGQAPGQAPEVPGQRPAPGQFQRIPGEAAPGQAAPVAPGQAPGQVPGQVGEPVGGTMGMIPMGSPLAPAPGAAARQPIKRQAPLLGTPGSVTMSMSDIQAMMARQQAGAAWVGVMIDQYVSQSTGQPIPNRQPSETRPQLPAARVKRASRLEMKTRRSALL